MAVGRLQHRADFLRIAGQGRKWVTPGLILQAASRVPSATGPGEEALRVGFTVSRRVGNAVERNRARRRLRAVVREILDRHGKRGHDYVVIGRRAALKRPYRSLIQDLETALVRLDIFVNPVGANGSDVGASK